MTLVLIEGEEKRTHFRIFECSHFCLTRIAKNLNNNKIMKYKARAWEKEEEEEEEREEEEQERYCTTLP